MIHLALNDLKLFLKDKKAVFLTFLMPIILIALFAIVFGGLGKKSKSNPVGLLIADLDNTELSQGIVAKLDSLESIKIETIEVEKAKDLVTKGKRSSVLVLHKGLQQAMEKGEDVPLELIYDSSREIEMNILRGALMSQLAGPLVAQNSKKRALTQIEETNAHLGPEIVSQIKKQVSDQFDTQNNSQTTSDFIKLSKIQVIKESNPNLVQAVAGTAVMMLLFSVAGMGSGLLKEKEEGTLKRLLYSPIKADNILFGKLLSTLIISTLQLIVMFLFAWVTFGLNIFTNVPALLLMIVSTAFVCSAFGVALASICKTRKQIEGMSTIVVLLMSAIGGSMMPIFFMPAFMQQIAKLSVNYWSIQGFFDIFWRDLTTLEIAPKALILFGIGFVLILFSIRAFRKNILAIA